MRGELGVAVQDWFFGAGRTCASASELLHGLCMVLRRHGMPVQRANLLVRTRQPQLEMLVYIWRASDSDRVVVDTTQAVVGVRRDRFEGGEVETVLLAMGHADEATWLDSPFHACLEQGAPLRRRLFEPETPRDFPILLDLSRLGMTDYLVMPVALPAPYLGALSVTTDAAGGFSSPAHDDLIAAEPAVALGFAHHVVQQANVAVLAAYIGVDPAHRVLDGAVKIGDSQSIDAVIGFTDLRGFTRFSSSASPEAVLQRLTRFFGAVHRAVSVRGGEILKFMGDGAMFVFPVGEQSLQGACAAALDAMTELRRELAPASEADDGEPADALRFATALHHGSVLYGNIGAVDRLDFTVLGSAVNQTARLETVAKRLDAPVVVSAAFAAATDRDCASRGRHRLPGLADPVEVFVPVGLGAGFRGS